MPHRVLSILPLLALVVAGHVQPAVGAPPFTLTDGGRTFVYRARPGEPPMAVATSFGIPQDGVEAFLAANGITDARRVPLGFEYRIPNPLASRLEALAAEVERLEQDVAAGRTRVAELERARAELAAQAVLTGEKEERLAAFESRWPIAITALVLAVLGLGGALAVARRAVGRLGASERRTRALAHDLEERRQTALAERQETGHRIVELENRLRRAERQPRLAGGRG